MGAIAPMNIFLRQEIDRMQRVIKIVRNTLQDLKLAVDGTIIMSEVSFLWLMAACFDLKHFAHRISVMLWTASTTQKFQTYGGR